MRDEKRKTDPGALEAYLETRKAYEGGLAPEAERLVDALQAWQHETRLQPHPSFSKELAQKLQKQRSTARRPRFVWSVLSRVLAGGVTVAVAMAFVFLVSSLFRGPITEPTNVEVVTRPPRVSLRGTAGLFAGVEFLLNAPLGEEAQDLAVYVIEAAPLPETPEEVRDLALALGMKGSLVFRARGATEGWIAYDDAGRRLSVNINHVRFPLVYHAPEAAGGSAAALPFADAGSRAVQFLEQAGLLSEGYELREQLTDTDDGLVRVEVIPTLDGHPVHYVSSEVVIEPGGEVVEARVQPLTFAATDETVHMQPELAAFNEVLESHATIDGRRHAQLAGLTATYFPSFKPADQGTTVTLIGFVETLQQANDQSGDGPTVLEFSQHLEGINAIQLIGPGATGMEDELYVEVTGTLVEQLPGGRWRMAVSGWQPVGLENDLEDRACQEGMLEHEGDKVLFHSSEGETFVLAYPPDAPSGEPAYVCASFTGWSGGQPIRWLSVTSPALMEKQAFMTVAKASDLEPALEASGAMPGTLVVDWATPGYLYRTTSRERLPGQRLAPTWLFYTRSLDGTLQFVLSVPLDGAD